MSARNGTTKTPWRPAANILRDMIHDPEKLIICPGVYDGLDAGHEVLYMAITKRYGHLQGKLLVSTEEYLARIRAAVLARGETGRDLVIIPRSNALQSLGFDEAVKRLKGAVEAGADVAFLEGFTTEEQGKLVCEALAPTPCLVNVVEGGVTPQMSATGAREAGFRIVIWPCLAMTEVYNSVKRAAVELKEKGFFVHGGNGAGRIKDLFEVAGLEECMTFDAKVAGTTPKEII
ncbi:Phosphoenolpyruvate/pyruvate domain-containing protein [Mytilinidion resinicola]|uniref:Phosphoenolpyruvate/pyruvate domain-containing protein n=1 Tax=Mytilinidion resinicola TaxID=574789 RepID=A0A6A6Z3F3_9PEZI|nr:Phosphoenolpyruvate/pyruvate domain-containing protein [Mytilinidion resinicola]KAF2815681.1 Phosphoenolpyruvate/pyruvate domain-containing protein [Mytilinidion resinicola]